MNEKNLLTYLKLRHIDEPYKVLGISDIKKVKQELWSFSITRQHEKSDIPQIDFHWTIKKRVLDEINKILEDYGK